MPTLLNLFAIAILLNIWLTGASSLATLFNIPEKASERILMTTLVFIFYFAAKKISTSTISFFDILDSQKQYSLTKYSNITIGVLSIAMLIKIWIAGDSNFSTYFGLLSAGLAIALQDVVASLAGWVYLISVKPFSIGERIKIGNHSGDVADIRTFHFSLQELADSQDAQQPTGRIIHIPNREIFRMPVANFHAGFDFIWHEIPILITFESNWKKAEEILDKILEQTVGKQNQTAEYQIKRASRSLRMYFSHLQSKVWISVVESGVLITLRFLCNPREKREISSKLWRAILDQFGSRQDIDFAYPTQRYYHNQIEGKKEARAQIFNTTNTNRDIEQFIKNKDKEHIE
ncbi:MAG: mechanosensitive ion channel [Bdellovibrionota bacterium]